MSGDAPTPVLLDCDPGHDDAVAILLALGSPDIHLLGITTCFGNCAVEDATRNAQRVLALVGREDVPVAVGASGPMRGELALGNYVHGVSGLDGPALPDPTVAPIGETATEFLARCLAESPEPVTVVVTGPMTNLGVLLAERPDLTGRIREIVFMGGSTERGNHTPTAEFNTFADPEALDVVLRSGVPLRMVGLNLTHQALATPEVVERMSAMPHEVGRICAAWMGFFGDSYERIWEFAAPPVHDPCTIASLLDPDVIGWRDCFVAVELDGTWTRGTTVVDLFDRLPDREPNVEVALELDAERYWDLVLAALDRFGLSMTGLVCVVGSLNDDTTLSVATLPAPGETTLTERERLTSPGGKGANQAAAAAVLGARVAMVGAVGNDEPGDRSLAALRHAGVDLTAVAVRHDVGTGIAVITVDANGENTIVVDPGANASLTAHEAAEAVSAAQPAVLLLQLEVPQDAVNAAARAATGAVVVLNPAPMPADPGQVRDVLPLVDVLVPNRSELGRLAGHPEPTDASEVAACVAALDHAGSVVVTLGAEGALCFEKGAPPVAVPGVPTETRDASGAGDVFCGCLAQQLAGGAGLLEAVRHANALAAASTAHPGARVRADLAELAGPSSR